MPNTVLKVLGLMVATTGDCGTLHEATRECVSLWALLTDCSKTLVPVRAEALQGWWGGRTFSFRNSAICGTVQSGYRDTKPVHALLSVVMNSASNSCSVYLEQDRTLHQYAWAETIKAVDQVRPGAQLILLRW